MDLNFYANEGHNLYKFAKYNIENINGKKYIVPESSDKSLTSGAPLIDLKEDFTLNALVDLLNLGKLAVHNESSLEDKILEFVNKYSTLGLMNDLPINKYFFLDENVILKDFNYVGNSDFTTTINCVDYFKMFFPKCTEKQIEKLIKDTKKIAETPAMEKYITEDINKHLIGSNWYCEPLDMFIKYVTYMYNLLNAIINKEDTVETKYSAFEVNNINMFLTQKENVNIEIPITSLKQFIDFYFAKTVSQDVNLLKICKFCNNAFIANNPKAEYDTPQCKNKANVYKSRAKNK